MENYTIKITWDNTNDKKSIILLYSLGYVIEKTYQDYQTARLLYALAARNGLPKAKSALAYLYEHGLGTEKNVQRALVLYEQAANEGDRGAQNHLGRVYLANGECKKALKFSEFAASQNDPSACMRLCRMLLWGEGTDQDYKKAMYYYRKARRLGARDAERKLQKWLKWLNHYSPKPLL